MTFRLIGIAAFQQFFGQRDHAVDVVGGAGFMVGVMRAQGGHILMEYLRRALGYGLDGFAGFLGCGVDLIIDVGDVSDIRDLGIYML